MNMYAVENTHSLHNGKYHCTADLMFEWFGFNGIVYIKINIVT